MHLPDGKKELGLIQCPCSKKHSLLSGRENGQADNVKSSKVFKKDQ